MKKLARAIMASPMRGRLRVAYYVAVVVLAMGLVGLSLMAEAVLHDKVSTGARAFTMQTCRRVKFLSQPDRNHESSFLYALRGDGARLWGGIEPSHDVLHPLRFKSIIVPAERKQVGVSFQTRTTTTFYFTEKEMLGGRVFIPNRVPLPQPGEPNKRIIGEGEVLGIRVVKIEGDYQYSYEEHWVAPELDCMSLWSRIEYKGGDGNIFSLAEESATSAQVGEPMPELFEIPSDFEEVSPSEAERRLAALEDRAPLPDRKALQERADQNYLERRKLAPK